MRGWRQPGEVFKSPLTVVLHVIEEIASVKGGVGWSAADEHAG
jgi:hypothetical protein